MFLTLTEPEQTRSDPGQSANEGAVLCVYGRVSPILPEFPADGLESLNAISAGHRTLDK